MAVFCKNDNLLFIGNTRTGSTALGRALVEFASGVYVHSEPIILDGERVSKRRVSTKQLDKYNLLDCNMGALYKFVAVRNPFDLIVSKYVKLRYHQNRAGSVYQREKMTFEQFVLHMFKDDSPTSMHEKFVDGCDKIIYFENL